MAIAASYVTDARNVKTPGGSIAAGRRQNNRVPNARVLLARSDLHALWDREDHVRVVTPRLRDREIHDDLAVPLLHDMKRLIRVAQVEILVVRVLVLVGFSAQFPFDPLRPVLRVERHRHRRALERRGEWKREDVLAAGG